MRFGASWPWNGSWGALACLNGRLGASQCACESVEPGKAEGRALLKGNWCQDGQKEGGERWEGEFGEGHPGSKRKGRVLVCRKRVILRRE